MPNLYYICELKNGPNTKIIKAYETEHYTAMIIGIM